MLCVCPAWAAILQDSYKRQEGKKADWEFKDKVSDKEYQKDIISKALDIWKKHWFMIDLYPENEDRFKNANTEIE